MPDAAAMDTAPALADARIGYVLNDRRYGADPLFAALARELSGHGVPVCGLVQINTHPRAGAGCDMDVEVLPAGRRVRISQSLGPGARGCRLDTAALEAAVAEVARSLEDGPALLMVNKFGKREAAGAGFRPVIAEAVARAIPVLLSVSDVNLAAFRAFACDWAHPLPPDRARLCAWALGASAVR